MRVAIVGAGVAGAACAAALGQAGWTPTLLDKSRGIGGRLCTRRASWTDAAGARHDSVFDHGAQYFTARDPRFAACLERGRREGWVAPWPLRVRAADGSAVLEAVDAQVAVPGMPALVRALADGVPVQLGQAVTALERRAGGWALHLGPDEPVADGFDAVVVAVPPWQAVPLVQPVRADWARQLAAIDLQPCWTLMAVAQDPGGEAAPWEVVRPARGPLSWIARNDRKPGRTVVPGQVHWVAQADPVWSRQHLEHDAATVEALLLQALADQVGGRSPVVWLHRTVHRWRYALAPRRPVGSPPAWWDGRSGLGVCGDGLGGPRVEAAFLSGQAMAEAMLR